MPFVYILRCGDGSLYTGSAKDLARRLAQHARGRASRYTRSRLPVALVWRRRVRSWTAALREERRIKALPRVGKDALVGARARTRGVARTETARDPEQGPGGPAGSCPRRRNLVSSASRRQRPAPGR